MTTPDDRLRADWTSSADATPPLHDPLNYYAARKTVSIDEAKAIYEDIDTSTTAGKIAVMQAHASDWRTVECRKRHGTDDWSPLTEGTPLPGDEPAWNWRDYDYRIAPPAPPVTALMRARSVAARIGNSLDEGWIALGNVVREIDRAPTVWFGVPLLDQCGIVGAKPGRYRLVRDDGPGDAS